MICTRLAANFGIGFNHLVLAKRSKTIFILIAISLAEFKEVLTLLLRNGASLEEQDNYGVSAMQAFAKITNPREKKIVFQVIEEVKIEEEKRKGFVIEEIKKVIEESNFHKENPSAEVFAIQCSKLKARNNEKS